MAKNNGQTPIDTRMILTAVVIAVLAGGTGSVATQAWPWGARGGNAQGGENVSDRFIEVMERAADADARRTGELTAALAIIADAAHWAKERKPMLERFAAFDKRLDQLKVDLTALPDKYLTLREFTGERKALWSRVLKNERNVKDLEGRERAYLFRRSK